MATAGPDLLVGTSGADRILGLGGNDVILGHAGQNTSQKAGTIAAVRVGAGFSGAVSALSAPGDPDRLYVITKDDGVIHRLDPATGAATDFLDIPASEMTGNGERGLLGLAFHPDYADAGADGFGKFYVFLTNQDGDLEIREYAKAAGNPPTGDLASERTILTIAHPTYANHNGGSLAFGPDGYLYISTGDGGGTPQNGQNTGSLLGKILRIDVNVDPATPGILYANPADNPFVGVAGADEIWAYGLRNPWRISFDPVTGDLYIGDVGQNTIEEIDFQAAGAAGGANYGWSVMEGTLGPGLAGSTLPIFEYTHDAGVAVTGGFVYRGPGPTFVGTYFLADFGSARMWTLEVVGGHATKVTERTEQIASAVGPLSLISSFGTDGEGRLYVVTLHDGVFRLDFSPLADDVADRLFGGPGNDRVYGGAGDDLLMGGAGADFLSGGFGGDRLYGATGRDVLAGGPGSDVMAGGAGRDVIGGGFGNDRLVGGPRADSFVFNTRLSAAGNVDTVVDFSVPGGDSIRLNHAVFTGLVHGVLAASAFFAGAAAHDPSDRIVYDPATGDLLFDRNGAAAGGATPFANLAAGLALSSADFFVV